MTLIRIEANTPSKPRHCPNTSGKNLNEAERNRLFYVRGSSENFRFVFVGQINKVFSFSVG